MDSSEISGSTRKHSREEYEEHWDVQLVVGGRIFKGQRAKLAAVSEHLDIVFRESNTTREEPIPLPGIDAATFDEFLDSMCTDCKLRVNDSNVLQWLVLIDFLKIREDCKRTFLEFVENLYRGVDLMSNALDLLCWARSKGEDELVNIVSAHICRHLDHFSKDARLMEFSFNNLKILLMYGRYYILPSHRTSFVLLAIMHNWINWNREGRSKYRCELLGSIEFPMIIGSMWGYSRDDYEKHWDVQLTVSGRIFRCQRASLAVISEHLDTMFSSSDFGESNASPDQPITMPGIDAAAFDELLDCMFTGDLHVDDSNVLQLLILNDFLKLRPNDVQDKCLEFVKKRSTETNPMKNALDLLSFDLPKKDQLLDILSAHICRYLDYFSKDARLMELSFDNLKTLLTYGRDYILPPHRSSRTVLAIIHNWINCNRKERSKHRRELMGSIEFPRIIGSKGDQSRDHYEKHWDVQLVVGGRIFKGQRAKLAAVSEHLDTVFRESNATREEPIPLPGIDAAAFDEFLDSMCTDCKLRVNDSNVLQWLVLIDFLKIREGCKKTFLEFVENLYRGPDLMSNALDLLCWARSKGEDELVIIVSAHICRHLDHFSNDARLMGLSFDNLKALLMYGRDYNFPSYRSSLVLLAIIHNWIDCNREERSKHRCELMGSIEFPSIIGSMWDHSRDDYEKHWDVQFTVGGRIFKCQRALLAVISEHLDTMLSSSDFGESNAPPDQPITMPGIDAAAFDKLLDCMFTGDLHVDESNFLQLLILNDFLKLRPNDVKDKCVEFVKNRSQELHPMSNALDLFFFAGSKGESVLFTKSISHICEQLYHFSMDARFMQISFENLKELLSYAKSIFLPLPVSSNVLLAIIHNWVNCDRKERSKHRYALLESIVPSGKSSDSNVSHDLNVSSDFAVLLIKRLEYAIDEMELSEDSQSTSELRTLKLLLDPGYVCGNHRLSLIIGLDVKNINSGTFCEASSPFYAIAHLSWRVLVGKLCEKLSICVQCDGSHFSTPWKCHASALYAIISHEKGKADFVDNKYSHSLFSSELPMKPGCIRYLLFDYVINPENGFIVDDSITIHALLQADVPFFTK